MGSLVTSSTEVTETTSQTIAPGTPSAYSYINLWNKQSTRLFSAATHPVGDTKALPVPQSRHHSAAAKGYWKSEEIKHLTFEPFLLITFSSKEQSYYLCDRTKEWGNGCVQQLLTQSLMQGAGCRKITAFHTEVSISPYVFAISREYFPSHGWCSKNAFRANEALGTSR